MLGKLFGIACIVEMVRTRIGRLVYTLQHNLKAQVKQIARIFLLISIAFVLFSLGLRFLLYGLACWLNAVFSSTYLGFFLVSMGCFLMVLLMVLMLRSKINNQEVEQDKITDGE